MAKKKVVKNIIAEQIKALIDAGDYEGAQALISGEVQNSAPAPVKATKPIKKKGRPPKKVAQVAPPPPPSSPANNTSSASNTCIAPSRRVDAPVRGHKITKDGKEYTMSVKVPWTKPKKVTFKEDKAVARDIGLHYPDRAPPRDPAEQSEYICHECSSRVWLYPGQAPDGDMLFTCDNCMKRSRRR